MLGFHEPSWLQKNIFDMNQSELEGATEKLSNMLETEDIMKWCNEVDRVEMINQTNQVHLHTALACMHADTQTHTSTQAHQHSNVSCSLTHPCRRIAGGSSRRLVAGGYKAKTSVQCIGGVEAN